MGGQDWWVGLEGRVCEAAPFNTKDILGNHLTLVVGISGFALAGFVLLLDRGHDPLSGARQRGHTIGALMLALSAVVGLVAAYMFSSITGDHCLNTVVQFDFPSALLAVAALLMVAGVSVVTASHRQLADTATALRWVVVLAGLLVCWRLYADHHQADSVARRYEGFIERVEGANGFGELRVDAGATSSLDRQLGLHAESLWQDASQEEIPGLLAQDFFNAPASRGVTMALLLVASTALAWALWIAWRAHLGRQGRVATWGLLFRGPSGERFISSEAARDLAERKWRRELSTGTVLGMLLVLMMFTFGAGSGRHLNHPPSWCYVGLFAFVCGISALAVQPPVVGEQRSLIDSAINTGRSFQQRLGRGGPGS